MSNRTYDIIKMVSLIAIQVQRYSSGTANSKWRPATVRGQVILLRDLEIDPLPVS